ncbi:PAS domain-containing protein [Hyphomicrobium methylovorum]|uniref:PAS domain-containing protein n=1 Tax=Hyphomicrobium methylovorum TaxID=84 RepID=UPI0015E70ADF|nr:PAS domain-containing protein [Hyphomicrobium methylovorum]MBA2124800.1 PAS domain-containing protein [Hyphomicrobium methylovorum]
MIDPVSQTLFAYWNRLRGDRLAPKRFEIEPSAIAAFLPDTFILERIDARTIRFRLAGTRISEAFGVDFRGVNLFDLFEPGDRSTLQREMTLITAEGAVGVFQIGAESATGYSVAFEFLVLPLTHTGSSIERFLGSCTPLERPCWLGDVPLTRRKLVSHSVVWPDGRPTSEDLVALSHRQTPFLPTIREARIVKSDRRQFRVYDGGLHRRQED